MDNLRGIVAFVTTVKAGSFSQAARSLGLTPAAVSKSIATLEAELGVRLFQRSTRSLALTEAGLRFHQQVEGGLRSIEAAVAAVSPHDGEPEGTLKISLAPAFGREHILPLMDDYLQRYPRVRLDWHFDNRQVDLIGEGFDACIGGGLELDSGVIARELAPLHLVMVASPAYLARHPVPLQVEELAQHQCVQWRSPQTGRLRDWQLQRGSETQSLTVTPRIIVSDPDALCRAVLAGLGVGLVGMAHVREHLDSGALQRLLPEWHQSTSPITLYYASQRGQAPKLRSFIDFLLLKVRDTGLAQRLSALNL